MHEYDDEQDFKVWVRPDTIIKKKNKISKKNDGSKSWSSNASAWNN